MLKSMTNKEYFESHGIDEQFVSSTFGVTSNEDKIYIPIKNKEGEVVFTKVRNLNTETKFDIPAGEKAGDYLFNADKIKDEEWVIYCEGEVDCMRLIQEGIPAVSGVAGVSTIPKDLSTLEGKDVYLCLDSDEAGKRFTPATTEALEAVAKSVRVLDLQEETKDVCEYFASGKTVDDFIELKDQALSSDELALLNACKEFEIESLEDLALRELPEERWLIENIVPAEGFVLIAGEQATGKSFITLSLADAITTGKSWLDTFPVSCKTSVLFIDKENGDRRTQDRMNGLGITGKNIYRVKSPHLLNFTDVKDPSGVTEFARHISRFVKIKKIGLIVVDSLVDVVEGSENLSGDIQLFLDKFRFLFPDSAILLLHHEGKPSMTQRSSAQRTRGSTNIQAQMSASFSVSRLPNSKNEFRFEQTKARDSLEMNPFKINMVSIVDTNNPHKTIVSRLMHAGEIEEELAKGLEVASIIQDMLPRELDKETVVIRQDIFDECKRQGIGEKTVKNTISQLLKQGSIASEKLPAGHPRNDKFSKTQRLYIPMNTQTFYQNRDENGD